MLGLLAISEALGLRLKGGRCEIFGVLVSVTERTKGFDVPRGHTKSICLTTFSVNFVN